MNYLMRSVSREVPSLKYNGALKTLPNRTYVERCQAIPVIVSLADLTRVVLHLQCVEQ